MKKKHLISYLQGDCGLGLVEYHKRHGAILGPGKHGGWKCEPKKGWNVVYNGMRCSHVFSSFRVASDFVDKHRTRSVVIVNNIKPGVL